MRHHAIVTQRLASWISSGDIIPTIQSSYTTSSNISFIRRFAGVGQSGQSTSQGGQEPPPPPPPGMFAVVSSMIAGAGGAVLVAGIGYVLTYVRM